MVKLAEIGDTEERRLLRSYVTWSHLRRLRGKEKLTTPFQNASIRNEVKSAVKLLEFLRRRGRTLTDCTQADLDQWCLQGDRMPLRARGFVAWCVERRHIESIRIPAQVVKPDREVFVDDEQRWDLVRRLLHDDSLATVDRVAGQLVLLYGQKVSRIIQLTIDDVTEADGLVQLRLGRHPLVIPDPLDQLILQLVDNRRGQAAVGHTDDHHWLFAGGVPGQPLHPQVLAKRLKRIGVPSRIGRNSALMENAHTLPAKVLSDLLGLGINLGHAMHHAGRCQRR